MSRIPYIVPGFETAERRNPRAARTSTKLGDVNARLSTPVAMLEIAGRAGGP